MEPFIVSTGVVALAEIGDKTQLLAFFLAARFKKPPPVIAGILTATLIHHGLAGALGAVITRSISPDVLRWLLGLSFLGMAAWTLIADKLEEEEAHVANRFGIFGATLITFFLAEMGDKTQIATVALAAHYGTPLLVVIGTTLGMLIADVAWDRDLAWRRRKAGPVNGAMVFGGEDVTREATPLDYQRGLPR